VAKKGRVRDDAKRQRRMDRKAAEAEARRSAERRARLLRWVVLALALLVAGAGIWFLTRPGDEVEGVEKPPNRGRDHVTPGEPISYDSPTPTSGPHWSQAPRCGTFTQPLDLELAVHALEHGAVILWYQPDFPEDDLDALRDIARRWDSHVIVSPNEGIDGPVVATAWRRLKAYDGPGEDVAEFVDTYRRRGPESVDCPS